MPKKRASTYDTKPSSSAHPSLSSSKPRDVPHSLGAGVIPSGNAVNDRIQQLRLSQTTCSSEPGGRPSSSVLNTGVNPSLPPSLRQILQLPEAPPPRPRPGLRITGRPRGPAGPAAPESWLEPSDQRVRQPRPKTMTTPGGVAFQLDMLPDSCLPDRGSLVATTLKNVAKNWTFHKEYNQYYLPTIPVRYKEALLHYIAQCNDHGIDRAGLDLLFQDELDLEDATGAEGLSHLDLSRSIGHPLKFTDLRPLFSSREVAGMPDEDSDSTPENWDSVGVRNFSSAMGRFDSLTHLSLAHPNKAATWKGLLEIAPHLATVTHLSLAYWPTPTLSPNSRTAYRETPQGAVDYGASNFYSTSDCDFREAASIMRRLSKSTYCLRWLDLTGCYPWVLVLEQRMEWDRSWQVLDTIKIGQGWLPSCLQASAGEKEWEKVFQHYPPKDDQGLEERSQLIGWATIEKRTIALEAEVLRNIRESWPASQSLPAWGTPAEQASDATSGSMSSRRSWLTFEHGWDAWWIKEAVTQITKANIYGPPRNIIGAMNPARLMRQYGQHGRP